MNQRSVFGFGRSAAKQNTQWQPAVQRFEVASRIELGTRPYQQDALLESFPGGDPFGIAVLADGMGGHASGDLASATALSAAFTSIKTGLLSVGNQTRGLRSILASAIEAANLAISRSASEVPDAQGMGSTLVACVTSGHDLHWISVGDSPLYLYRDGDLRRLNENHSMAAGIDAMVASGMMSEDVGASHPQRSQLTSALCGERIQSIDCPHSPLQLEMGDIVVLSSDGLQTLPDDEILETLKAKRRRSAAEITESLMQSVSNHAEDEQDNISLIVIKVTSDAPASDARANKTEAASPIEINEDGLEKASDLLNQALRL